MADHVEDMERRFADHEQNLFDEWWGREGRFIDPDTSDIPWYDKRRALAEHAFHIAMAISRNYVADDDTDALQFTFANGRIVQWSENGLRIGMAKSK